MIENSAGWRYVQSADSVADYPTVSEHNAGKFQDLKSVVAGKAPVSHTHPQSQVTGLDSALAGKAPVSHTHPQSQVTGLDSALAGKAPVSHTHSTSQVTGLDEALAGKAPVSHTHPQSQVTGLEAALDGKAAQATLDTRVPAGLALRIDTTVGTRIFAGSTMIFGDTGWRDISTLGEGIDFLRINRYDNRVSITGSGTRVATGGTFLTKVLPPGFLPTENRITRGFMAIKSAMYPVGNSSTLNRLNYQSPPYAASVAIGDQLVFEASWTTTDPWPTSLPGLPA